jgi:hypothetical protein
LSKKKLVPLDTMYEGFSFFFSIFHGTYHIISYFCKYSTIMDFCLVSIDVISSLMRNFYQLRGKLSTECSLVDSTWQAFKAAHEIHDIHSAVETKEHENTPQQSRDVDSTYYIGFHLNHPCSLPFRYKADSLLCTRYRSMKIDVKSICSSFRLNHRCRMHLHRKPDLWRYIAHLHIEILFYCYICTLYYYWKL